MSFRYSTAAVDSGLVNYFLLNGLRNEMNWRACAAHKPDIWVAARRLTAPLIPVERTANLLAGSEIAVLINAQLGGAAT